MPSYHSGYYYSMACMPHLEERPIFLELIQREVGSLVVDTHNILRRGKRGKEMKGRK